MSDCYRGEWWHNSIVWVFHHEFEKGLKAEGGYPRDILELVFVNGTF